MSPFVMSNCLPKSIGKRLSDINELLTKSNLESINPIYGATPDTETEYFTGKNKNDERSNDSRVFLHKKTMDFYKVMEKLGCALVFVKAGAYGSTFKGIIYDENKNEKNFALKVVAYGKCIKNDKKNKPNAGNETDRYGNIFNLSRPENAEIHMLKVLSYFVIKRLTPHIILPISTFNCHIQPFLTLHEGNDPVVLAETPSLNKEGKTIRDKNGKIVMEKTKYGEFLEDYKKGMFYNKVSILISEWCDRCDLGMFLRERYKLLRLIHWKCLFFQIIITIAQIQQKYPEFKHNDLKLNNILIQKSICTHHCAYRIDNLFFDVPPIGYMIYLWDFDFACIPHIVDNQKVYRAEEQQMNISSRQNRYYDIHYFFCSMIYKGFLPQIETDPSVPYEVKEFIQYVLPTSMRPLYVNANVKIPIDKSHPTRYKTETRKVIAPESRVSERSRLIYDDEYLLPIDILKNKFFDDIRKR